MIVVRWETLGGSIKTAKFYNWNDAQIFADKKQESNGTQWVDIEEKE